MEEHKHSLFAWLGQARPAQVKSVFVNKMWGWVRMNPHDVFYLRPGLSCAMIGMAVQGPVAVSHMLVLPTPPKDLAKEECYIPACHIIRDNLILHQRDPMFSDLQELIPLLEGGGSQGRPMPPVRFRRVVRIGNRYMRDLEKEPGLQPHPLWHIVSSPPCRFACCACRGP